MTKQQKTDRVIDFWFWGLEWPSYCPHSVKKSQKKSHTTLRAKRATFTLARAWSQTVLPDRSVLKGQKTAKIQFFKLLSIAKSVDKNGFNFQ